MKTLTSRRDFIKQTSAIVAGGFLSENLFSACQMKSNNPIGAQDAFYNPPSFARPGVFWDWLNGNITKEGITRDLEAMSSKGIMRAEIWDVRANQNTQMVPAGKSFLGDESVELIKHAL
ncbi:MAG: twin-arginine translocation signal domain-containing protein, partial [Dysgonamonadaceae bacterium]|nr:twin-arginine translocation signal domain-containing protein [Dysgonamonadaceae bacterium]